MKHSPTPWIVSPYSNDGVIQDANGSFIGIASDGSDIANARRIVLCMNILNGISDENLEILAQLDEMPLVSMMERIGADLDYALEIDRIDRKEILPDEWRDLFKEDKSE